MTNNNDKKGRKPQVWRASGTSIKYIPLSSLKKFIEENEKEIQKAVDELGRPVSPTEAFEIAKDKGHNSALKLLKDKFIHE